MHTAPLHPDEPRRLHDVRDLNILDTPGEERFDRITRLARDLFAVPIAVISLVDRRRQWFKSRVGLEVTETDRDAAFCAHAILRDSMVVEDTHQDPRFADHPLVTGEPGIRFYASATIRDPSGQPVGTLCLIDREPRTFPGADRLKLRDLALMLESEFSQTPSRLDRRRGEASSLPATWRTMKDRIHSRTSALLIATLLGLASTWTILQWDRGQVDAHRIALEKEVLGAATLLRGEIETALNTRLHLAQGLSGYVRADGVTRDENFSAFAEQLAGDLEGIRSLQLAPGGVVTHVWPLAGNRKAIGHDLLADPARRAGAEKAIAARRMWISGPFELLQGGTALVAREPIFLPDAQGGERFWGFGTVLIDLPDLIDEVGFARYADRYDIALRGKDGLGLDGETFLGDPRVFEQDPILQTITLPAGSWVIGAQPRGGFPTTYPGRVRALVLAVTAALLLVSLIYYLLRLPARQQAAIASAVAEIERGESVFQDAIEALPSGFVIYDREGGLVLCNDRFRDMHPVSRAAIREGQTLQEISQAAFESGDYRRTVDGIDDPGSLYRAIREASGRSVELELGDGRWVRAEERPMRDGGTAGFWTDITQLKQSQAALGKAKIHAEQANQAKSEFLASVSHEVRTPLNGVLGLLGMLKDDAGLDARQRDYAQTAHRSAQHLLTILNEILDISKIEAGKLELETQPFDLVEVARESVGLVATEARSKGLELAMRVGQGLDTPLLGDPGRLRQVLLNLLNNAVKFTEAGTVTLQLACQGERDGHLALQLGVSDTGIGFDPDRAERLFERFTQADASTVRRHGGTGLGLPISRELVEMMGGTLTAEGRPGEGATFTIDLALRVAPDEQRIETDRVSDASADPKQEVLTPAGCGLAPVRVLVAEDSPTNQMVLSAMLEGTGYQIDAVADGAEAVEAVGRLRYDLVLMDVQMPNLDGVEATRQIRTQFPDALALPIIALTANAMKGDRERFLDAGMCDYLPKPISRTLLLERLWHWSSRPPRAVASGDADGVRSL